MIKVEVTAQFDLLARARQILAALRIQVNKDLIGLQSYIVRDKLSGQVLHRRSGTLADSVRVQLAEIQGDKLSGSVQGAGGPAFYGRAFEEGGRGSYIIVPVRAKVLAWQTESGETIFSKRVNHPPIPKKPWMGPAFQERKSQIIANLRAAAIKAARSANP